MKQTRPEEKKQSEAEQRLYNKRIPYHEILHFLWVGHFVVYKQCSEADCLRHFLKEKGERDD